MTVTLFFFLCRYMARSAVAAQLASTAAMSMELEGPAAHVGESGSRNGVGAVDSQLPMPCQVPPLGDEEQLWLLRGDELGAFLRGVRERYEVALQQNEAFDALNDQMAALGEEAGGLLGRGDSELRES